MSWSPDGRYIAYWQSADLWALPLDGDRKPFVLMDSPDVQSNAQVSPDGKWLAYQSTESSGGVIYVVPFPKGTGKWRVSGNHPGAYPRWRGDGKELFYLRPDAGLTIWAAAVNGTGTSFEAEAPKPLFASGPRMGGHTGGPHQVYAVSKDGQRFLIPRPLSTSTDATTPSQITVVLNWTKALEQ